MSLNQGSRFFLGRARVALLGGAVLALAVVGVKPATGQRNALPNLVGIPEDWSHHHLVFAAPRTAEEATRVQQDPRYWQQWFRRNPTRATSSPEAALRNFPPISLQEYNRGETGRRPANGGIWGMSLGSSSATVGAGNYPAKYTFNSIGAPNCATDYVVYNTSVAGSSSQANIVAYNNLYSGTCTTGTVPQTYWAYNTGAAPVKTSVVLSSDGSQVAFIATPSSGASSLVLLKWTASTATFTGTTHGTTSVTVTSCPSVTAGEPIFGAGIPPGDTIASCSGTTLVLSIAATNSAGETLTYSKAGGVTAPVTPNTASSNSNYHSGCALPCMYSITFSGGSTATDSTSSPFYDYTNDVLYVGDDIGVLHKFTGVFNGSPAEAGTPWPVTVASGYHLTSPVYDSGASKLVFVGGTDIATSCAASGDGVGYLFSVNSSGTVAKSELISRHCGLSDSPVVDSSSEKVYVFTSNDQNGTSSNSPCQGYSGGSTNSACNGVFQFITTVTTAPNEVVFGLAVIPTAPLAMYAGTFDNTFYTDGGTGGYLYVCGYTTTGSAGSDTLNNFELNQIPVSTFSTAGTGTGKATMSGATATGCSPVSEVYTNSVDYIYLSVQSHATPTPGTCSSAEAVDGCVYSYTVTSGGVVTATSGVGASGGASGIIIDNMANGTTGAAQIYFSYLSPASSTVKCPAAASGASSGSCAVQASQAALQ